MMKKTTTDESKKLLLFQTVILLVIFIVFLSETRADSFVPQSDDQVLLTLSPAVTAIARSVRAQERSSESNNAGDAARQYSIAELSSVISESYVLATRNNDPRAFGHTLSLIGAWPEQQPIPAMVRLIHASVLQHNHEFMAALQQLDTVLSNDPANLQARLIYSQVSLVIGDYEAVAQQCQAIEAAGAQIYALNCGAQLQSITGNAEFALSAVEETLLARPTNATQQIELLLTAATTAERLGFVDRAERYYRAVLSMNPQSLFTTLRLSAFLLHQGRPEAAIELLRPYANSANDLEAQILLVRALQGAGMPANAELLASIGAEIESLQRLGDEAPHKLLAQYQLYIAEDFATAVRSASLNWKLQKEPGDTLLLASAAVASEQSQIQEQVRAWITKTGLQDARIQTVLSAQEVL